MLTFHIDKKIVDVSLLDDGTLDTVFLCQDELGNTKEIRYTELERNQNGNVNILDFEIAANDFINDLTIKEGVRFFQFFPVEQFMRTAQEIKVKILWNDALLSTNRKGKIYFEDNGTLNYIIV